MESAQSTSVGSVNALDHINIRTPDLQRTVQFLSTVLGLTPRKAPGLAITEFAWLFTAGGAPIFHLQTSPREASAAGERRSATGPIDHVALDCSGYDEMIARLASLDIAHRRNEVKAANLRQIFITDPNGIVIELNYRDENTAARARP
jgi:catechol 2,3-dioxygenase-like lactoylglutathione lyase family enzyme